MDENQIQSIAVNLLTPLIGRLLGWVGATLSGGAGITLTTSDATAGKIATLIVGLLLMIAHQLIANWSNKNIAKAGFVQGAAAAGMTLLPSEVPPVVSGSAPTAPAPATTTPMGFTTDAKGNVTLSDKINK